MLPKVAFAVLIGLLPVLSAPPLDKPMQVTRVVSVPYPWLALTALVQGKVRIAAVISPDGTVESVRVLAGSVLLAPTAGQALRKWRFVPCTTARKKCETTIVFSFVIGDDSCGQSGCQSEFRFDVPNTAVIKSGRPLPNIG
jgi:TonB family protein